MCPMTPLSFSCDAKQQTLFSCTLILMMLFINNDEFINCHLKTIMMINNIADLYIRTAYTSLGL